MDFVHDISLFNDPVFYANNKVVHIETPERPGDTLKVLTENGEWYEWYQKLKFNGDGLYLPNSYRTLDEDIKLFKQFANQILSGEGAPGGVPGIQLPSVAWTKMKLH